MTGMVAPEHPAHDTRIEIDGDVYWVRRDFDLIKRVEQAFGALGELDARLRRCALTGDELVRLTAIALKAQGSRPPDDEIQAHVVDVGIKEASEQLAVLVLHLFAGHKRTVAWLEAEARKSRGETEVDAAENPLMAALSTGISSLRRQRPLDGLHPSSGGPRFTT